MQRPNSQQPYQLLGQSLRQFRERQHESVAEVSGAVEIESELLEQIERGEMRPSEDILNLLITHFDLREHEAVQLWEWAGFARANDRSEGDMPESVQKAIVMVALDARVLYSNGVIISTDTSGLVLNFMQPGLQAPLPAARIGMSYEQAAQVLSTLQMAILRQRYLPERPLLPPTTSR